MGRSGWGFLVRGILISMAASALLSACFSARPATPPTQRAQLPSSPPQSPSRVGIASWYGPGFNGRRTANGEIYDQEDLTAASTVLPLGTRVMVTNLDNARSVEVRINDRGPFVKGREIDLSHRAAQVLGIIRPGTARVRVDVLGGVPAYRLTQARSGYFVQVGSFSRHANAERLRKRLAANYTDVHVDELNAGKRRFYRVRMGSFATRDQAHRRAIQTARLGLPILVVKE